MYEIFFKNATGEMFSVQSAYGLPIAQSLWDTLKNAGFTMQSERP